MSNALAIAAVTAVLRDLLNNGLIDHDVTGAVGGNVTVSALPPDRVFAPETAEGNQLNLFLHQVTPNTGWSNVGLPSRDGRGDRLTNPPLALDLHYLLTAYGADDLHAEILLGYAMQLLHETPVLTRGAIRKALAPPDAPVNATILPPALSALRAADLADQVEQIKITPEALNTEEMSKLWTALQAHYRPTAAYHVSVVLIESTQPARSPLPVLYRGPYDSTKDRDAGVIAQPHLVPPYPTLEELLPPDRQVAVRMGETLTVRGHHFDADQIVARLTHTRSSQSKNMTATNATPTSFEVMIPIAPEAWQVGVYSLAAILEKAGEDDRVTNELPLALAPKITGFSKATASGSTTLTVTCQPQVWRGQPAVLVVGDHELTAKPFTAAKTTVLEFEEKQDKLPSGDQWVRLRVDGISSILIDRSGRYPKFHDSEKQTI